MKTNFSNLVKYICIGILVSGAVYISVQFFKIFTTQTFERPVTKTTLYSDLFEPDLKAQLDSGLTYYPVKQNPFVHFQSIDSAYNILVFKIGLSTLPFKTPIEMSVGNSEMRQGEIYHTFLLESLKFSYLRGSSVTWEKISLRTTTSPESRISDQEIVAFNLKSGSMSIRLNNSSESNFLVEKVKEQNRFNQPSELLFIKRKDSLFLVLNESKESIVRQINLQ